MSRLLASLKKLHKLKKHHIEELRQQIALVNQQIDLRHLEIEKNIRYINTERLIASVNIFGGSTLEAFASKKHAQNRQFEGEIQNLKATLREIEDQLFEAYKSQKQLEKVEEQELASIAARLKSKEISELDEIATQMNSMDLTKF